MRLPLRSQCLGTVSSRKLIVHLYRHNLPEGGRRSRNKNSPAIIHVRLHAHVKCPQVLDPPPPVLNPHTVLINAQCLIPLTDQPLIRLVPPRCIWRNRQPWPQRIGVVQIRQLLCCSSKDLINPISMRLEIQIVPQAVAVDESGRSVRLPCA